MSFGKNLQYLRKMQGKMTQEELAERLSVSRQTVSKWELDDAYPEISKLIELSSLFSCSLDELLREEMDACDEAYSDIREETVPGFSYVKYAVVSREPEDDAISHVNKWAEQLGLKDPYIIGWDFPQLSQEQVNVYNFHGYAAALKIDSLQQAEQLGTEFCSQESQKYMAITIRDSMNSPFTVIPGAYKTLMTYMRMNSIEHKWDKSIIDCFEYEYEKDGVQCMDVYIAAQ